VHRYTHHLRGAAHGREKRSRAGNLQDFAVFCVISFRTVHGLVQVRIETLTERLNAFHASLARLSRSCL